MDPKLSSPSPPDGETTDGGLTDEEKRRDCRPAADGGGGSFVERFTAGETEKRREKPRVQRFVGFESFCYAFRTHRCASGRTVGAWSTTLLKLRCFPWPQARRSVCTKTHTHTQTHIHTVETDARTQTHEHIPAKCRQFWLSPMEDVFASSTSAVVRQTEA